MEFAVYTVSVKGFFTQHYEVYLDDELVYTVRKPSFWSFSEYIFYDTGGYEILKIKKQFTFFTSKFIFYKDDKYFATFEKKGIENFYNSSSVHGRHTVQGDFFSSEFTIFNDEGEIAKVSRKRFRSNKKYGIAIIKGNDELYVLAIVIAISMIQARSKKKA